MSAYDAYFAGQLQDYAYPTEAIQEALKELPEVSHA
jgi:tryptophan synthase beta chain